MNGPTWTTGKINLALAFNGTNYVNVPSTAALNAYPLTLAVWVKTATTAGIRGIVNKYVANSWNGYQVFTCNGNLCAWYIRILGSTELAAPSTSQATTTTSGTTSCSWLMPRGQAVCRRRAEGKPSVGRDCRRRHHHSANSHRSLPGA